MECHFYQEGDILKTVPQVFLRKEDESAFGWYSFPVCTLVSHGL